MKEVFVTSENTVTSLGFTTEENVSAILSGKTGIKRIENKNFFPDPFYASLVDNERLTGEFSSFADPGKYTRFEQLAICSVKAALSSYTPDVKSEKTLFILSTTKGNIDLLEKEKAGMFEESRVYLWQAARMIQQFFGFVNTPLVVSNACISGVEAVIIASRLIRAGLYDDVVINGTDILSEFVVSGFNSFKSLSNGPCKPFDKTREGLSIGEGSGTIILSSSLRSDIIVGEGAVSNDANHISGPSRTGEGLFQVISRLKKHHPGSIDYISAHGTATPYNDEMEAIAITRAGLQQVPVNSMKGYWGHTLGAAGIIECNAGLYSLANQVLFNTLGYSEPGTTDKIEVIDRTLKKDIRNFLKIASGFGGCNAGLMFYKA